MYACIIKSSQKSCHTTPRSMLNPPPRLPSSDDDSSSPTRHCCHQHQQCFSLDPTILTSLYNRRAHTSHYRLKRHVHDDKVIIISTFIRYNSVLTLTALHFICINMQIKKNKTARKASDHDGQNLRLCKCIPIKTDLFIPSLALGARERERENGPTRP